MTQLPQLPDGYKLRSVLSERDAGLVLSVDSKGKHLVLRIEPPGATQGSEVEAELEVLAAVEHHGLVPLVDFGHLADGRRFVARPFVEGVDLSQHWGPARMLGDLVALLVDLLTALQVLHKAGFVHGDLKPRNVLVTPEGQAVLTDFGLSRPREESRPGELAGGTWFYAAPELLLGAQPSPASDLFALGVLVHELHVGERRPAAEFYAEFPRRSFLEAAGTPPERLPKLLRTWTLRLLGTDPNDRPADAAEALRDLSDRVGLGLKTPARRFCTKQAPVHGFPDREDWVEEVLDALGEGGDDLWLEIPGGEDHGPVAQEIALAAARRGLALELIDLDGLAEHCATAVVLDEVLLARLDRLAGPVFVHLTWAHPWARRAAELLVRADRPQAWRLAILTAGSPIGGPSWIESPLPLVDEGSLIRRLGQLLEADDADLRALATSIVSVDPTVTYTNAALAVLARAGALAPGEHRPRLRAGASAALTAPTAIVLTDLPEESREVLALAVISRGALHPEHLSRSGIGVGAAALLESGLLERGPRGLVSVPEALAVLGDAPLCDRQELLTTTHSRESMRFADVDDREHLFQAVCASPTADPGGLSLIWLSERECGAPERVLFEAQRLRRLLALQNRSMAPELVMEEGLSELASGAFDRAEELARHLGESAQPARVRALGLRLGGRIAEMRHQSDEAQAAFLEALEFYPAAAGEIAVARANHWYAIGRGERVVALLREAEVDSRVSERQLDYLRAVVAMVDLRRGEGERASSSLKELIERARKLGDRQREAALAANLATVHRRLGRSDEALEWNRVAIEAYRVAGHLPGLALARNQLGGLLREVGQLSKAEAELQAAADLRGRLGDQGGRAVVRGTLGLLRAGRGHAVAALEDLTAAARDLEGSQVRLFGPLLHAHIEEQRALLGDPPGSAEELVALTAEGDHRVGLALGRAAILRGKPEQAAKHLRRSQDGALAVGDLVTAAGAAFLLANGLAPPVVATRLEGEQAAPLVAEDRKVLALVLTGSGELPQDEAVALAEDLESRGRDNRAARLWLRIAAEGGDKLALERSRAALQLCQLGASVQQLRRLRVSLLGLPDPRPDDLDLLDGGDLYEEADMDLLRLLEINHRLVEQANLPALLGTIVEEAISVSGAERGFLILEEHGIMRLDVARDSSRGGLSESDFEVSGSVLQRSLDEMSCLRISNAAEDPLLEGAASVQALDLRSVLCASFRVDEDLRGAIYLDNRLVRGAFDERAERLLGLLVDQASIAIGQVRRREEIERLNRELSKRVELREAELQIARRDLSVAGLPRPVGGLVGRSAALEEAKQLLLRSAPTDLSVLIVGESGTGKELAARALHDLSNREQAPFVSESCAAMPASLIEAELFGVRRGAFTGAERDRAGLFEQACGGTLFLDEVGEMPLELQAKLLRVLETREVRPVGGHELITLDFRLVTATNRDLEIEVAEGRFRQDLYYRVRGLEVRMPSLGECTDDVPEMVQHFLEVEGARSGVHKEITPPVLAKLVQRTWPGNVRELRNEVSRLHALSGAVIEDPDLIRDPSTTTAVSGAAPFEGTLAELEQQAIQAALARFGGDKRAAAKALGISRAKVYQRLKEWSGE